jgi:hypothetical protein
MMRSCYKGSDQALDPMFARHSKLHMNKQKLFIRSGGCSGTHIYCDVGDPPLPGTNKTDNIADHGRSRSLARLLRLHRLGKILSSTVSVPAWHY